MMFDDFVRDMTSDDLADERRLAEMVPDVDAGIAGRIGNRE